MPREEESGTCGFTWRADPQVRRGLCEPQASLRGAPRGLLPIEVIDLLENPKLAKGDQILAIPTLVRKLPEPVKKIIGDLSNTEGCWWAWICGPASLKDLEVTILKHCD